MSSKKINPKKFGLIYVGPQRINLKNDTLAGISRSLSVIIALGYLVVARGGSVNALVGLTFYLVFAVVCIWFADELSEFFEPFIDFGVKRYFFYSTPPLVIRIMAWGLLLLPAIGIKCFGVRWLKGQ
jgi:hypothetical protein